MSSDVACFREYQALQDEAAHAALYGLAMIGGHDAIIARMEIGARTLIGLFEEGRDDEAWMLWENGILEDGIILA